MFFWNPFPFLRISLATAGGILLAYHNPDLIAHAHWFCLGFAMLFGLVLFWSNTKASKLAQYLSGFLLILFFASFGYVMLIQHDESRNTDHIQNVNEIEYWQGKVEGWLEERENTYRAEVFVESVFTDGQWKKASGRVLTYFSKPTVDTLNLQYGTELLFANTPRPVDPPMNPNEFDYQSYLANQQIFHQHFVGSNPIEVIGQNPSNPLLQRAYKLRSFYQDKLSENIAGEQEKSIVLALLLGIKDGLDHDLKEAFSAAGAMHILAVSGLHVGIIFLVLSSMFSFLKTKGGKKGIFLFLLINLAALWLYALLAGASPSVLRASTMFSMILLTQSFSRKSNIYNSLALAAFVLLIYNPFLLFSVGFQLSFLAVFGIVFIQPKLSRLLVFDSWLMQKGWELTAVSVAAQLATFPLGLLYFHRFPNYFLISNLVVIPGAFAVLFIGVFFFLTSWLPFMASLLGTVLYWLVAIINKFVFMIEALPLSSFVGVWISPSQAFLLYAIVIASCLAYGLGERFWLRTTFIASLIFLTISYLVVQNGYQNKQLTFYRIPGFSHVEAHHAGLFSSRSANVPADKIGYHVQPSRIQNLVNQANEFSFIEQGPFLIWEGKSFLFIENEDQKSGDSLQVNYLVLGNDAVDKLEPLVATINFDYLIIDSSNSWYRANQMMREAEALEIQFHSILHQGAFTITTN